MLTVIRQSRTLLMFLPVLCSFALTLAILLSPAMTGIRQNLSGKPGSNLRPKDAHSHVLSHAQLIMNRARLPAGKQTLLPTALSFRKDCQALTLFITVKILEDALSRFRARIISAML